MHLLQQKEIIQPIEQHSIRGHQEPMYWAFNTILLAKNNCIFNKEIYELFEDEIPYHTAVLINEFKEKENIVKIQADIIVHRETQKAILIGERGKMIKAIGTNARKDIEAFIQQKIFLELFVKVRPKWRDNDLQLKEYGYQ